MFALIQTHSNTLTHMDWHKTHTQVKTHGNTHGKKRHVCSQKKKTKKKQIKPYADIYRSLSLSGCSVWFLILQVSMSCNFWLHFAWNNSIFCLRWWKALCQGFFLCLCAFCIRDVVSQTKQLTPMFAAINKQTENNV